MGKGEQKVYMPLMHGDWLKGTQGMKAEVRGVYLNLLLFQWNNGHLPADWEELCLIDPELPKVWEKLKPKFTETAPGQLQNKNLEEIRAFWAKQKNNGKKGGRKPKVKPKPNPETNPNNNLHNDIDIDSENVFEVKNKKEPEKFEYVLTAEEDDEDLIQVKMWTNDVITGNDYRFKPPFTIDAETLANLARDHLGKCGRYGWHQNMTSQQAFRESLINFIRENNKPEKGKQPKRNTITLKDLENGNA